MRRRLRRMSLSGEFSEVTGDGRETSCGGDRGAVRGDEPEGTRRKDPEARQRVGGG